jgi:UDP-N-acetylglucosamine 2-epimerase (hydrolysing)
MKRIAFLTGTRADYGKIKPLIKALGKNAQYEIHILVTGMHLLEKYGATVTHIMEDHLGVIHLLPNQHPNQTMETSLARTIEQISEACISNYFDMMVVHGDRIEALAGAIVGVLRNIPVAHIEGGEVSGTVDGLIRHSVSKLSHIHFVSNKNSKQRLIQLGESVDSIHIIGSPDIDVMLSNELPTLQEVLDRYAIPFERYGILIFHPVTNEIDNLREYAARVCKAINKSSRNYVVIKPNNDLGSEIIQNELDTLSEENRFVHLPSMRFEYFLQLLKSSEFIVGNSSAGVREAAYYGVPAINIGTRQRNRHESNLILNTEYSETEILEAIKTTSTMERVPNQGFGDGNSGEKFAKILSGENFWPVSVDKQFVDVFDKRGASK